MSALSSVWDLETEMVRSKFRLMTLVGSAFLATSHANIATAQSNQTIEVAFVLDATGSMADLIAGAKKKIWSIANTIVDTNPQAEIKMSIVAYRDRGDAYVIKPFELTNDIQGIYGNLMKIEAEGGGDTEESVNEALDHAVRKLNWTTDDNAKRIIFLVGDAPPHMDYDNERQYPEILKRAKTEGIVVNTVLAGDDPDTRKIWKEIAQTGNGRFVAIPQDGGRVTVIETPFDNDIIIIQRKIDETIVPYGTQRAQEAVQDKVSTRAEAPAPSAVENSKYYARKGGKKEVVTGGGDLLDAIRNGDVTFDALKDDELPADLAGKTKDQIKAEVEKRTTVREALEKEMVDLVKKRDDYVVESASKTTPSRDSFDETVKEMLKEQVKP